jgi:hypothetical protein
MAATPARGRWFKTKRGMSELRARQENIAGFDKRSSKRHHHNVPKQTLEARVTQHDREIAAIRKLERPGNGHGKTRAD